VTSLRVRQDRITTALNFCQERCPEARALQFIVLSGVVELSFG
jgi:hypothetical protein